MDWREGPGDGHAGEDSLGQFPRTKDHGLAVLDVGGHCPERNGQFVEIVSESRRKGQLLDHQVDFLSLNDPRGQGDFPIANPQLEVNHVKVIFQFPVEGPVPARLFVLENVPPVHVQDGFLEIP